MTSRRAPSSPPPSRPAPASSSRARTTAPSASGTSPSSLLDRQHQPRHQHSLQRQRSTRTSRCGATRLAFGAPSSSRRRPGLLVLPRLRPRPSSPHPPILAPRSTSSASPASPRTAPRVCGASRPPHSIRRRRAPLLRRARATRATCSSRRSATVMMDDLCGRSRVQGPARARMTVGGSS